MDCDCGCTQCTKARERGWTVRGHCWVAATGCFLPDERTGGGTG